MRPGPIQGVLRFKEEAMRIAVGVFGSAGGDYTPDVYRKAYHLGQAIAKTGCALVTGACPGLPYGSVEGARDAGGLVIGISPGHNLREHVGQYESPVEGFDVLVFTGDGLMGRETTAVRTCDIVIIIGGRSGTLGELAIAYEESKIIGVLEDTGGLADHVEEVIRFVGKDTGAIVIYDKDPESLVSRLLEAYHTYRRPLAEEISGSLLNTTRLAS